MVQLPEHHPEVCREFMKENFVVQLPEHHPEVCREFMKGSFVVQLPEHHPEVYREVMKGNYVVQHSRLKFSLSVKDQSHEQTNKILQANGGISNLYDSPEAMALYMLIAPDSARIVGEFAHHEAYPLLVKFLKDARSLAAALCE